MTTIRFPEMRENLRAFSESLADVDYQKRVWVDHEMPPSRGTFTDMVHFFYDDTTSAENPERCVGVFLRDRSEAEAARKVVEALDAIFADLGTSQPDGEYVASSDWPQVVPRQDRCSQPWVDWMKRRLILLHCTDEAGRAPRAASIKPATATVTVSETMRLCSRTLTPGRVAPQIRPIPLRTLLLVAHGSSASNSSSVHGHSAGIGGRG